MTSFTAVSVSRSNSARITRRVLLGLLVVLSAGCVGREAADGDPASVTGMWWLDSLEVGGIDQPIEVGVNTSVQPWVEITDRLSGSLGCNDFWSDGFTLDDWLLVPGEVVQTAALCGGPEGTDVMSMERIMSGLFSRPPGIEVEYHDNGKSGDAEMIWINGATRLSFIRSYTGPTPTTSPPPSSWGRLDCSPGTVIEVRLGDMGVEPEQILLDAEPEVVRVEAGEPLWWWGLDASGRVVAALAEGDITPVQYQLLTCTG